MKIRLIRHATMVISLGGKTVLVDPMLAPAGTMEPVANSPNPRPNPLVDLPEAVENLLAPGCVLVTHTHRDHFDAAAAKMLPKSAPLLCQPPDAARLQSLGFTGVIPIPEQAVWNGITFTRCGGQHGRGEIGREMAPVSGFVLSCADEPTLYIAGDTIWCEEVASALDIHQPDITVAYAGAAQFLAGGPITMDTDDILALASHSADMRIVVVHMEAFNHCLLSREKLRTILREHSLDARVFVPDNGAELLFQALPQALFPIPAGRAR